MPAIRGELRFLLNDAEVRVAAAGSGDTLLDWLRLERRLRGTKEGCAEGDCGACTVLIGRVTAAGLRYETVNACIRLLASVEGCHVVTVEHLSPVAGPLHPVQQALVDHHGSQCGFCTPGIVMSLYALWMENPNPDVGAIETALQGNLCRCTGYGPILRAAEAASKLGDPANDRLVAGREATLARLAALRDGARVEVRRGEDRAVLPADVDDLAAVLEAEPNATIVAGATDVGLWITKFMRSISPAVFTGHLEALKRVELTDEALILGAGASYSDAEAAMIEAFPHLAEFWPRIGGWQVRNMGTVGGNVANGSPIGDTPPVLIALGAEITLRKGGRERVLPVEDFFIAYGRQDREPGEFVAEIRVPRAPGRLHAAYKITKRRDEDISSVCGAFSLRLEDGVVRDARLAFGGMAATPKRARAAEAALVGQAWDEAAARRAAAALAEDFTPITDWRASAGYRARVAGNLLRRFWMEGEGGRVERLVRA
jgi:xanthine dehydrogenase small subunit